VRRDLPVDACAGAVTDGQAEETSQNGPLGRLCALGDLTYKRVVDGSGGS
jgi:hypothetical protein